MTKKSRSVFTGFDLKDARDRLGMTQRELADELCIARTSVIKAERDTPKPWMEAACIGLGGMRIYREGFSNLTGERFGRMREKFGFTAEMLGSEWGVTERTIRSWEHGVPPAWALPAIVGLSIMTSLDVR
jgi:DNA-binding XRE family transcriptional regulator